MNLERLSHQFFTFLPERLRIVRIEGVPAHTFADGRDGHVVGHDTTDVAILAILRTDLLSRSNRSCPHRGRGSLGNGLPLERPLSLSAELLIDLFDYFFDPAGLHVSAQLRPYTSRMDSRSAHAPTPVTFVECDSKEDVCRFRSAISDKRLIGRALKVRIVQVHVRVAMTGRRQVDEPPAIANKRRNPVDQNKVA